MAILGIDIGGQSTKAGLVSRQGKVLEKDVFPTEAERGRAFIVTNITQHMKSLATGRKIDGIGVGIPGIVDSRGFITYTPNIPLSSVDLGKEIRKHFKVPLFFGNDADNFALAQLRFGAAKGVKTAVTLTLGTGVGSGLIINGKLFSNKGAPEFGHTTIKFDAQSSQCCHNNGCLESFLGRKSFKDETPLEMYKRALNREEDALQGFEEYGKLLGVAIANAVNMLNPDIIILGGQLANAFEFFRKTMDEEVKKRALFPAKIVKTPIRDGGLIGAAALAF